MIGWKESEKTETTRNYPRKMSYSFYIEKENGKKAVVMHFACHPTILNASNRNISGDFPGVIQSLMEEEGYEISFFLNGSGGDISTRFTRQDQSYEEAVRMGKLFQDKIIKNRIVRDGLESSALNQKNILSHESKKTGENIHCP